MGSGDSQSISTEGKKLSAHNRLVQARIMIDGMPQYPHAYEVYRKQCEMFINSPESRIVIDPTSGKEVKLSRPEGEVLLIPPQPGDYEREKKGSKAASRKKGGSFCPHWIACLFTSSGYGKGKSPELAVLRNTRLSVEELRSKVETVSRKKVDTDKDEKLEEMGGLYGCRFNAGLFGVEWERTKQVLENVGLIMTIVTPPV